jgi:phage FluMu protein Com
MIDPKYLKEYRCTDCHKLLCKGFLNDQDSVLEVKCRGCGKLCQFSGTDAEIVKRRSVLITQGLIPDTDVN